MNFAVCAKCNLFFGTSHTHNNNNFIGDKIVIIIINSSYFQISRILTIEMIVVRFV